MTRVKLSERLLDCVWDNWLTCWEEMPGDANNDNVTAYFRERGWDLHWAIHPTDPLKIIFTLPEHQVLFFTLVYGA